MTADAPGILAAIDGALRDSAVSRDAMRWVPEGERQERPRAAVTDGAGWINLAGAEIVLGRPGLPERSAGMPFRSLADFSGTYSGQLYPGAAERLPVASVVVPSAEAIRQPLADFGRALAELFRPLVEWAAKMAHDVHRAFFPARHGRCLRCHPERTPKPLAVDGHAYQRRLAARRKRRRR